MFSILKFVVFNIWMVVGMVKVVVVEK